MNSSSSTFYNVLKLKQGFSDELEYCIKETVRQMHNNNTSDSDPAMLFGEIQSGKTKTFIGIIAEAFDTGYDMCFVLTKSSTALAEQTYQRLDKDFEEQIEQDKLAVYDIIKLTHKIAGAVFKKKLIFVVKKQKDNIKRVNDLFESYPIIQDKRLLIIDDEADFASIGFKKDNSQQDGVSTNVIMQKINALRTKISGNYSFLQVTATPYALYLQPSNSFDLNNVNYQPIRPKITSIVPAHDLYIGGKYYFEDAQNDESPASYMFVEIFGGELQHFARKTSKHQGSKLLLNNKELIGFKRAIVSYIVSSSIRSIQEIDSKIYKSSCLIHVEKTIVGHSWQYELVCDFIKNLKSTFSEQTTNELFFESYNDFLNSIGKTNFEIPSFDKVLLDCLLKLNEEQITVNTVNSHSDVSSLLDKKGQLRLETQLNIFIGGDVLDRGLTIENLICFYYGRNPNVFQQDTVLQHCRMYGARDVKDLAVTRLYTTARIYNAMKQMYEFDNELRKAFLQGDKNDSVVFVNYDVNHKIRPTSPNKILISNTTTVKAFKRFLPLGFDTKPKHFISESFSEVCELLKKHNINKETGDGNCKLSFYEFTSISTLLNRVFEYKRDDEYKWDLNSFLAIGKYPYSNSGEINCMVRWNREISRLKTSFTRYQNAPDDGRLDLPMARSLAAHSPTLILLHQLGLKQNGWSGDSDFFWPVLITPKIARPTIFAAE